MILSILSWNLIESYLSELNLLWKLMDFPLTNGIYKLNINLASHQIFESTRQEFREVWQKDVNNSPPPPPHNPKPVKKFL